MITLTLTVTLAVTATLTLTLTLALTLTCSPNPNQMAALERDAHDVRMAVRPAAAPAFERPQLERGTLGAPVRLATNFTTLNIRAGQEVFKCEAACPNPMCQRLQPDLQRLQPDLHRRLQP